MFSRTINGLDSRNREIVSLAEEVVILRHVSNCGSKGRSRHQRACEIQGARAVEAEEEGKYWEEVKVGVRKNKRRALRYGSVQ